MVWLVDPAGRTVDRVEVRVTSRNAHQVTIAPTLKDGDRVVVAGVHSLRDGQAIKLDARP
jgi:multidrug efflux pump subunit AcrA (membrane-fusion protein)